MIIQVHLFGELGLRSGRELLTVELHDGATVADVVEQLQYRSGEVWLAKVGQDLVGREHILQEGDTLTLFPAVGGG